MEYARNIKNFTKEDIVSLSEGDNQNLIYDISQMDPRVFFPLIKGIQKYAQNHITSLTFTLDHYYNYCWMEYPNLKPSLRRKKSKKKAIPFSLANSAYRKIPNTINKLISMICQVLSNNSSLTTLKFRSIIFSPKDKEQLINSLSSNTTLRKLYFENINLNDESFTMLMKSVKHPGITSIECRQCGLTDLSIPPIKDYLNYHRMIQLKAEKDNDHYLRSVCLHSLDFRDNSFSTRLIAEISDILADIPLYLIDLRNNLEFDERFLSNMRRSAPHVEIRTGIDRSSIKSKSRKDENSKSTTITASNENDMNENDENYEIIELSPDIRIEGPRAREFVNYLEQINALGEELRRIRQEKENLENQEGPQDEIVTVQQPASNPKKKVKPLKKKRKSKLSRQKTSKHMKTYKKQM